MQKHFEILKLSRHYIFKNIETLSIEQLNKIPDGFKNNIIWNIAHLVVTQQLLCYKLSGLKCAISDEMIEKYQNGTAPLLAVSQEEFETMKEDAMDEITDPTERRQMQEQINDNVLKLQI